MEPIRYLRALRRRWLVIVASVVIAGVAAWATTVALGPPKVAPRPRTTYNATTTLWNTQAPTIGQGVQLPGPEALVNIVALPEVASIAARAMDSQVPRAAPGFRVYATVDTVTGLLNITGSATNPERAVSVSTAYSNALITYLERLKQKRITLQQQVVERQIRILQRRGSAAGMIALLRSQLSQLALGRTTPVPLAIFRPAKVVRNDAPPRVQASTGFELPKSLPLRVALAALLGLLAGLVLALVLERFDTRIRSPRAAEEAFGLPVLAEVPAIARSRRKKVVTASHPYSRAADAFRLVEVGTDRWTSTNGNGQSGGARKSGAKTILVTSPEARDGKTTVAANLAVAYAQAGNRVLAVSCDLRRPAIHKAFGVAEQPGLAEALRSTKGGSEPAAPVDLAPYLEPCSVVRVAVLPSGRAAERPGELLGSAGMQRFVERLKRITDVIILDCAPLVVASDVVPLLPQVDGVVLVARARKTRQELAASTTTLLERLGSAKAGVVLNDAREFSIPLAKRRMYRPTRKARRSAKQDPSPPHEESWVPEPSASQPRAAGEPPRVIRRPEPADRPNVVDEPRVIPEPDTSVEIPDVTDRGAGPPDDGPAPMRGGGSPAAVMEGPSSPQLQVLAPEPMIRIPDAPPIELDAEAPSEDEAAADQEPKPPAPIDGLVLEALQRQLRELRTQLEGLQIELPTNGSSGASITNGSVNGSVSGASSLEDPWLDESETDLESRRWWGR